MLLAACASAPQHDGPGANPPAGLERVPDAVPRIEPLGAGGSNKPYAVAGRGYVPLTSDVAFSESGLASWYGRKFHGRPTSSGEPYDMYAMTAAHKTLPIPSYARVRNPANGREVVVRVNDRGPFAKGRVIDLSYTAALKLGVLGGVAPVQVRRITHAEIRAGTWPRPPPGDESPPAGSLSQEGYWLQLGAFREREAALHLQRLARGQAGDRAVRVDRDASDELHRVQVGPYATRAQAQQASERLGAALGVAPLLLQLR